MNYIMKTFKKLQNSGILLKGVVIETITNNIKNKTKQRHDRHGTWNLTCKFIVKFVN